MFLIVFEFFLINCCNFREELRQHAVNHIQIHICVICKKECNTEGDLLQHWQEHVRRSVMCKYCKKRYMNKDVLLKHEATLHARKSVDRFILKNRQTEMEKKTNNFEVRVLIQNNVVNQESEEEEEERREIEEDGQQTREERVELER